MADDWTFPFTITIISVSTSATDAYGNPSAVDGASVTARADAQPLRADEMTGIDDRQIEDWRFYIETGATIDGGDRITWNGNDYEVIGPPEDRSYGSDLDHVRLRARRVT